MPSEVIRRRQLSSSICMPSSPSSFFSEEIRLPAQRQVGFWNSESLPDHCGTQGMPLVSESKLVSSSPREKLCANGGSSGEHFELSQHYLFRDQKTKTSVDHRVMLPETARSFSATSWRDDDQKFGPQSNLFVQPSSLDSERSKVNHSGFQYENSLFSSSLSDIFDRKLRLSSNEVPMERSTNIFTSKFEEDEPFASLEEIEAQTIGNLLPDDDDLLSGVNDDLGYIVRPNNGDDTEEDLFCSGGGLELEADSNFNFNKISDNIGGESSSCQQGGLSGPIANGHPSRTLFIRNIDSSLEDSELRALFEQYGDIRTLYTACKHRGFVMISYYDIRAAQNAVKTLQNKPLRRHKLDIQYYIPKDNPSDKDLNQGTLVVFNLDSSVSNDDLFQIFGVHGEIKEIRETPQKHHDKFIEFYDVRAAEAALQALNGSDVAGKRIKLETGCLGGAGRSLMQQSSSELEQADLGGCKLGASNNNSSSGFHVSLGSFLLGDGVPNGLNDGALQGLHSALQGAISPFIENPFLETSSSLPHNLATAARVASGSHHSCQHVEARHSMGQVNFGNHRVQPFHPHSLPEYHDGLTSGIPFNSSTNMSAMPVNINPQTTGAIDHKYFQTVGALNSHSFEHDKGAFGVSGTGNCSLHGHQFVWSNSNSFQNHPPPPMMWSSSPSFLSNIPAHTPSQMHGLPQAPSHVIGNVLPLHQHHVGSAPSVNPSVWERRHSYSRDSMEASGFHPGSLGSMGFSGGSLLHPMELASRNIFPRAVGSCIDPSISSPIGILSPQQRYHMFHGRSPTIPMPASYDSPNDRVRVRRSDAITSQADKKQFELDIDRIMRGEDSRTTLMIKNIPNKYTSKMLLSAIDEHHRGTYDFIYLPIDFKNKCNVGYAFINMINPQHIIPFHQTFNGKKWEKFNSEKVASLAYARIQGKQALIAHFQNSSLMNEDKRCRPMLFHSDGPNAGDQEPFPMGANIRSRPGRSKTAANEENHQEGPSTSAIIEEPTSKVVSSLASTKDSE